MAEAGNNRNGISGAVDKAFQAGVIHGDAYQGGVHHYYAQQVEWPCRVGVMPPRANCFQQRDLSITLTEVMGAGSTTVLSQVLAGLGGVGKTQLAAEFARQRWADQQIDLLVWITAESREAIVASYATAAVKIGQSTNVEQRDDEEASKRFLEWLATTDRRWLIVFDDVQNPRHLYKLWPPEQPNGQVVVTTRRQDSALTERGHLIEVGLFTSAEATDYLHAKLAGRPALKEGADELAAALGYLPLALSQAAAYLADRKLTCTAYLRRFTDRRKLHELVPEPESLPDDHRATLATTWSLSVELADELAPAGLARPMLEIAAVLDTNGIPEAVLTAPAVLSHLTTRIGRPNPVQVEDAREALHSLNRLSLATIDPDNIHRNVRVHALVQRATRDKLSDDHLVAVAQSSADALMDTWPEVERDTEYGQILRANTDALSAYTQDHLWYPNAHRVLFQAGNSRGDTGLVTEAANYFQHLYERAIQLLGSDHPNTLATRNNLARWRGETGDIKGAVAGLEELLLDQSRVLGPDHLNTLITRNNLAHWRGEIGDATRAVTEFEELITSTLRVLGPDHPNTLATRNNLARWRGETGDIKGAVAGLEELLLDQSRVLGPDHPDTLAIRNNLAQWRGEIGDATRAVTEFEELITSTLRVLGPDHPNTLATRNNLARWRGETGDIKGAVAELAELLLDQSRVLGPNHPDTLATRNKLAQWRGEDGDAEGAVAGLEELLLDQCRVLGPDHPNALATRNNLAHWRGEDGDAEGAVAEFEELLLDQSRVLGPNHPDTLATRNNLARWRGVAGDAEGAVAEFEELLLDQCRVLGPDHPNTLATCNNLARWRGETGDIKGAVAGLEELLLDQSRVLGPDHPNTLATRNNLAHWRGEDGDAEGAVAGLEELLSSMLRVLGPDHPDTLATRNNLAHWRGEDGDAEGAVAGLEELLSSMLRVLGPDHPNTLAIHNSLAHWRSDAEGG